MSFRNAVDSSLDNAERLLSDAEWLDLATSAPTIYALCILAQEEFAKAFILYLVDIGALPWNSEIRKMLRGHSCKHLFGLILDFIEPEFDQFLARSKDRLEQMNKGYGNRRVFPDHIADAINIICHEKANAYGSRNGWLDTSENPCDRVARKVGDGYIDKLKQNALYVDIGRIGNVKSTPLGIKSDIAKNELEKTNRFRSVTGDLKMHLLRRCENASSSVLALSS
jgi:AbiV family abortive infection protein